jgi:uncharacterized membrane protein YkoI
MKRRLALVVFAGLAASLAAGSPAFAEDGEDDGSEDSNGSDDSEDDSGDDDGGTSGGGDDGSSGGSAGEGAIGSTTSQRGDDHEVALKAVKNGRAVPLKQVLDNFGADFGATVLDVALFELEDVLRYRITFVDLAGRVRRVYYFAETGELIR